VLDDIIAQDLVAAIQSVRNGQTRLCHIIGNRVASNAMIRGRKNLAFLGILLREVAADLDRVGSINRKRQQSARTIAVRFLEALSSPEQDDESYTRAVWDRFAEFKREMRPYLLAAPESAAYSLNPEFTREARVVLADHLAKRREIIRAEGNRLLAGIANEMSRVINTHGSAEVDLAFYIVLRTLEQYYYYASYGSGIEDKIGSSEETFKIITGALERIAAMFGKDADGQTDSVLKESTKIIGDFASRWRELYIDYMDMPLLALQQATAQRVQGIEIPEETKKKLGKAIEKALEKEAVRR